MVRSGAEAGIGKGNKAKNVEVYGTLTEMLAAKIIRVKSRD